MNFTIKKRELSKDEKLKRAIFYYGSELFIDLEFNEPMYDKYDQANVKIEENLKKFDNDTKNEINNFAARVIYDRTIDLKCLKCDYEELDQDWDTIEEYWDHKDYPICYCPRCNKGAFVPLDIYKIKKK